MSTAQPRRVGIRAQLARTWRRWAGVGLPFLVVACAEGYGTDDEALFLTHGMSQEEMLRAMNRIGQQKHLGYQCHYQLLPGCVLVVEARRLFRGREPNSVPLVGKEAVISTRAAADEHDVMVRAPGSSAVRPFPAQSFLRAPAGCKRFR